MRIILLLNSVYALWGPPLGGHKNISANELAGLGAGAAAIIGAIGYLLLRRRHSSNK